MLRVDRFAAHVALASTKNRYYSTVLNEKGDRGTVWKRIKRAEDFEFSSAGDFAIERKNGRNYVQRKIFRPKRKGWHLCIPHNISPPRQTCQWIVSPLMTTLPKALTYAGFLSWTAKEGQRFCYRSPNHG